MNISTWTPNVNASHIHNAHTCMHVCTSYVYLMRHFTIAYRKFYTYYCVICERMFVEGMFITTADETMKISRYKARCQLKIFITRAITFIRLSKCQCYTCENVRDDSSSHLLWVRTGRIGGSFFFTTYTARYESINLLIAGLLDERRSGGDLGLREISVSCTRASRDEYKTRYDTIYTR